MRNGTTSDTNQAKSAKGQDVLIVVPSLNEAANIERVIRTLQADRDCEDALIVVSDGKSADETVPIVERIGRADPRVRVLTAVERLNISASFNRAVEIFGRGRKWLVRLDAHAEYPQNYPSRLVKKAIETGAASVVTPMFTRGVTCFERAAAAAQNSFLGTGGSAHRLLNRGGWVEHGHHAIFDLDYFNRLGGYDVTMEVNEDAEFDRRLIRSGGRIWLTDDLPITYFPRNRTTSLFRQYYRYGRGRAHTFARHGGRTRFRHFVLPSIAPIVLLALFAPLSWAAAIPAFTWLGACLSYGLALGAKKRDICAAGAGYCAIVMQFAWSLGHVREILSIYLRSAYRGIFALA